MITSIDVPVSPAAHSDSMRFTLDTRVASNHRWSPRHRQPLQHQLNRTLLLARQGLLHTRSPSIEPIFVRFLNNIRFRVAQNHPSFDTQSGRLVHLKSG